MEPDEDDATESRELTAPPSRGVDRQRDPPGEASDGLEPNSSEYTEENNDSGRVLQGLLSGLLGCRRAHSDIGLIGLMSFGRALVWPQDRA